MSKLLAMFCLLLVLAGCAPKRLPLPPGVVPAARPVTPTEEEYGHQVLSALSEQYKLDYNHPRYDELIQVVDRLTQAAHADKDPWHVYLFNAPDVKNAAATRGNHVFVWSGMLDFTKNDSELATVLSHEIAHVLAGHTDPDPNEEIKKLLINLGALAAGVAVAQSTGNPQMAHDLGNLTASLTNSVGEGILVNPYSRDKELEADQIGLFLMADAKYNPAEAIQFWSRAKSNPDFNNNLLFFSAHPVAADRLARLQTLLPQAMDRFHGIKTGPLLSGKDTFDWSKAKQIPASSTSAGPATASQQYRIISSRALLYREPKIGSTSLGEFRRGAVVEVINRKNGFLEILNPDHGYLSAKDVAAHTATSR